MLLRVGHTFGAMRTAVPCVLGATWTLGQRDLGPPRGAQAHWLYVWLGPARHPCRDLPRALRDETLAFGAALGAGCVASRRRKHDSRTLEMSNQRTKPRADKAPKATWVSPEHVLASAGPLYAPWVMIMESGSLKHMPN